MRCGEREAAGTLCLCGSRCLKLTLNDSCLCEIQSSDLDLCDHVNIMRSYMVKTGQIKLIRWTSQSRLHPRVVCVCVYMCVSVFAHAYM